MAGRSTGDFHCHSNRSDGTLSPTALVDLAAANGVRVFALTDHDTLDGLDEARAAVSRHPGMRLVPGVELACDVPGTEVHMLGLFVNDRDEAFRSALDRMRTGRIARGERIVAELVKLNAPVSWQRVREIAGEASIGRPHIARALVEAGHVASTDEAFTRLLDRNSPAYVERERLLPADAVRLIHAAGGLAVFAHPPFTDDYVPVAEAMATVGLDGMEVYYSHYDAETVASLLALAERLGLLPAGGSDYHGLQRANEREPGDLPMPPEAVERILAYAAERGCAVPEATR
ncbi:MAG: PHP domain-containing protein [Chloroflexi bacterium]|nr:PHP domain-containing protein [Chloroflexota bacterium]MQC19246.1 PHP domain-containing protein [Chloroflexota bacterium]